jgi:predicted metal-dependent peptidase
MDNDQLDTKLYDNIISKLLEDPRIDKKTLLHRFISKMEVDSKDEANRMNEEIASLKERSDNIQQRQNISQ